MRLNRHDVAAWLLRNGFTQLNNRGTGHAFYVHASGVKVVLPGHGPKELSRQTMGNVVRDLERAGFDRAVVKKELGAG